MPSHAGLSPSSAVGLYSTHRLGPPQPGYVEESWAADMPSLCVCVWRWRQVGSGCRRLVAWLSGSEVTSPPAMFEVKEDNGVDGSGAGLFIGRASTPAVVEMTWGVGWCLVAV